jgi:pimeloyl-ACP methyl ester carboxylesterase
MPRDPVAVVTELHDLLAAADVSGPYVMVGHSLGGAFSVLYARTYPDEVCALVVVDSPLPPHRARVNPTTWEKAHIMTLDPSNLPGFELESYDLDKVFDEIEAAKPLRDIPVVVVRRGDGVRFSDDPLPEGLPITQAEADAANVVQWEAQALWAESVPGAEVITVPDTTHYVQTERPDAVVAAVRAAIARI